MDINLKIRQSQSENIRLQGELMSEFYHKSSRDRNSFKHNKMDQTPGLNIVKCESL